MIAYPSQRARPSPRPIGHDWVNPGAWPAVPALDAADSKERSGWLGSWLGLAVSCWHP